MGDSFLGLGNKDLSLEYYRKSIELYPDNPIVKTKIQELENAANKL